jgi:hypothetical protein
MADMLSPAELSTLPKTNSLIEHPVRDKKKKVAVINRKIKLIPAEY